MKSKNYCALPIIFTACFFLLAGNYLLAKDVTLILGAVPWEMAPVEAELTDAEPGTVNNIPFIRGKLYGMPVVVSLTGVGKTNTGMVVGVLCNEFRPKRVIFSGTGARVKPEIKAGYIILAEETFFHDAGNLHHDGMQMRPINGPEKGKFREPVFKPSPSLLAKALEVTKSHEPKELINVDGETYPTKIRTGRITTGDLFSVNEWKLDEIRHKFEADLFEMEGASVGQACQILDVPWLLIRGGSDLIQAGNASEDYKKYGPIAAKQAALFTLYFIEQLAQSELKAN